MNTGIFILAVTTTVKSILDKSLYPGMLLCLIAASLGVPIPEDVPLILGGALCRLQEGQLIYAVLVGMIGVLSGDIVLYYAGRRFGLGILQKKPFSYLVTASHIEQMKDHFKKRGNWIIFFGRFFAGIRAVMCVTSGICRVPAWKFVLIDFTGALISVPFLIGLGWWGSNHIGKVLKTTMSIERIVGGIVVLVLIVWLAFVLVKRYRKRKSMEQCGGTTPNDGRQNPSV